MLSKLKIPKASRRQGQPLTRSMYADKATLEHTKEDVICVTTVGRRKKMYILKVLIGSGPLRLCSWKGEQYLIPERLVGATFCRGRMWIFEVRQGEVHPAEFRFTDRETRLQGEWNENPTAAFRSTYELTTGKILSPSFNGRAEVGVFSDAVRAILVALDIKRLQAMNSPLVQHFNTMVTVHPEHVHRDLCLDPLVTCEQQDAPAVEQIHPEHGHQEMCQDPFVTSEQQDQSIDSEKVAPASIRADPDDGSHKPPGKRLKYSDDDDDKESLDLDLAFLSPSPPTFALLDEGVDDSDYFDEFTFEDLLYYDFSELFSTQ